MTTKAEKAKHIIWFEESHPTTNTKRKFHTAFGMNFQLISPLTGGMNSSWSQDSCLQFIADKVMMLKIKDNAR
jgi:hypothetical protein